MRYELSRTESSAIQSSVAACAREYSCVEDAAFLRDVMILSQELPRSVRRFMADFKLSSSELGACLVSGYPIDQERIGPTPRHWSEAACSRSALEEQIALMLLGSLLGEPFGWATQQAARIVHDVMPIEAHETEQIGSNSREPLTWHTEDAFHPFQGDYVGLLCLRNPSRTATTIAPIDAVPIDRRLVDLLFGSDFTILPDQSHQALNAGNGNGNADGHGNGNGNGNGHAPTEGLTLERDKGSRRMPVLFGSPDSPFVRLDPYFMELGDSTEPLRALNQLIAAIDGNLREVVLEPGDFCFIDNLKAVHGRKQFVARYDGRDRWLKRLNLTRDLRKSRGLRASNESRILF